jgi:hypothetical protein
MSNEEFGRISASGGAGVWNALAFHCFNSPDLPMQILEGVSFTYPLRPTGRRRRTMSPAAFF